MSKEKDDLEIFVELSQKIREELGIIEHSSEDDLLKMGIKTLRDKEKVADQIKNEISSARLFGGDRSELLNRVELIRQKISRAIELWEKIKVNAKLEVKEGVVEVGRTFNVNLSLCNENPFDVLVNLQGSWPDGLRQIWESYPRSLKLKARGSQIISFSLQGLKEGTFIVGPFTLVCKADGMEESIFTETVKVEVRSLRPRLKIVKKVDKTSVSEGEEINVELTVENEGEKVAKEVYLKDDVSRLRVEGITEWRGELPPRSSQTISYKIRADAGNRVLNPATATFSDESGKQYSVHSNTVNINIQPKPTEKPVKIQDEKKKEKELDIEKIGVKDITEAAISLVVASAMAHPKIKKIAKKVIVDRSLRWTTSKQGGQEVTLIFEHPIAVVREDHKEFVRLRRATPIEILHGVDGLTARRLQEQFIHTMRGILNDWKPEGTTGIDVEEYSDTEAYERIRDALKEYGEKIDEEKLKELPRNPILICTYYAKRGLLRKETLMKVYVKTYADVEKLYFDEVDHIPMNLGRMDVSNFIRSVSQLKHPVIVLFCSPTGWDEETKRFAQGASDPRVHLVFIDLKTLEVYFNDKKDVLKELCSLMPKIEITYPEEMGEEVEKLDNLLLSGVLTQDRYIEEIKKLQSRSIAKIPE
ncbi:MAG: hypothetical protein FGF51_04575 [Candidatus Brockarchaeota archaeon]|nr:hypothetical protein [Candidatus Brockarchaeota archaeon]